jgi:hypothetical protein
VQRGKIKNAGSIPIETIEAHDVHELVSLSRLVT